MPTLLHHIGSRYEFGFLLVDPVDAPVLEGLSAVRLNAVLDDQVDRWTANSIGGVTGGVGTHGGAVDVTHGLLQPRGKKRSATPPREPDALDALLDVATHRKQGDGGPR